MRYLMTTAALLAAISLAACQSGPAGSAGCDDCAMAEASPAPGGTAAAASAVGGQRVSQDPRVSETARIQPFAPISRGAGDQSTNVNQSEGRVVSSGAGVTQGLQVPNAAAASAGGAIPQAVLQIRADIAALQSDAKALLEDARTARAMGDANAANELMAAYRSNLDTIRAMQNDLRAAECGGQSRITHYYFQQGQRVVQSVVSGTSSGNPSAPPISEEGGKAAAGALTKGSEAVMTSPPEPAASLNPYPPAAPVLPPALPDDLPPAGPAGNPNRGE